MRQALATDLDTQPSGGFAQLTGRFLQPAIDEQPGQARLFAGAQGQGLIGGIGFTGIEDQVRRQGHQGLQGHGAATSSQATDHRQVTDHGAEQAALVLVQWPGPAQHLFRRQAAEQYGGRCTGGEDLANLRRWRRLAERENQ